MPRIWGVGRVCAADKFPLDTQQGIDLKAKKADYDVKVFRAAQFYGQSMTQLVPTEQLSLSERRPTGRLLSDTPRVRRRLQEHGFEQPIPVRAKGGGGGFEVLGAVREYLAAVRLGLSRVPVTVLADLDDAAAGQLVHANYQLQFTDPIDEAEFYREKLDDAPADVRPSISRLARLTGKNRIYLSRTLALLDLHPEVQTYIAQGRISRTHARHLTKVQPPRRQLQLAERVIREGLSERGLAARLQAADGSRPPASAPGSPPASATAPSKDPDTLRLERHVTELLGAPFEIDSAAGVCTIRYFRDLDTLAGVLDRLGYRE